MGKGSGWIWAHIRSGLRAATDPSHAGGRLSWVLVLAGRRRDPRPLDSLGAALEETKEAVVAFVERERGAGRAYFSFSCTPRDRADVGPWSASTGAEVLMRRASCAGRGVVPGGRLGARGVTPIRR